MDLKIYSGWWYRHYVKSGIRNQFMRDLKVECFNRGIIVNEHSHGFGVFDKNYKFVKSSRQVRRNNGQFIPKFNHENIPYVDKDVVFVGNVYSQFGHFLLEHLNRAWALLDKKYHNMYVALINNQDVNPVPEYMYKFIELLGIPRERIIIVNETTQFRNVIVPYQGFNIPVYSSAEFGRTFDAMAQNVSVKVSIHEKVYVSRDALKARRTYGERIVQQIFADNGFHIIYPETLPLEQQVAIVKNCRVLAGCAGTALHLCLFMKPGGTVIQIKRNRRNDDNSASQFLINETKKLNSVFVAASIEKYPTGHGYDVPQVIGLNKYMRQFFDDNGFEYDASLPIVYEDAWNEYMDAVHDCNLGRGGILVLELKKILVRVSALFIPGRERRGAWRRWLKKKLRIS